MNKFLYSVLGALTILIAIILIWTGVKLFFSKEPSYDDLIKQQELLRKELEFNKQKVMEYRQELTLERDLFGKKIRSSEARYDSLEKKFSENEASHKKEISRLKKSTLKQLEDEAEFLYRAHSTDDNN